MYIPSFLFSIEIERGMSADLAAMIFDRGKICAKRQKFCRLWHHPPPTGERVLFPTAHWWRSYGSAAHRRRPKRGGQKRAAKLVSPLKTSSSWKFRKPEESSSISQYAKQFEKMLLEKLERGQGEVDDAKESVEPIQSVQRGASAAATMPKKRSRTICRTKDGRYRVSRRLLTALYEKAVVNVKLFPPRDDESAMKPPRPDIAAESLFYRGQDDARSQKQLDMVANEADITRAYYARRSGVWLILALALVAALYETHLLLCEHFYADPEVGSARLRADFEKLISWDDWINDRPVTAASLDSPHPLHYLSTTPTSQKIVAHVRELLSVLRVLIFLWQTRQLVAHSHNAQLCDAFLNQMMMKHGANSSPLFLKLFRRVIFKLFQDDNVSAEVCIRNDAISLLLRAMDECESREAELCLDIISILLSSERRVDVFLGRNGAPLDSEFNTLSSTVDQFPHMIRQIFALTVTNPNFGHLISSHRGHIANLTTAYSLREDRDDSTILYARFVEAHLLSGGEDAAKQRQLSSPSNVVLYSTPPQTLRRTFLFLTLGPPYLFARYYSFGMWNNLGMLLPQRRFKHVLRRTGWGFLAAALAVGVQAATSSITAILIEQTREHPATWRNNAEELITTADVSFIVNVVGWTIQIGLVYSHPFTLVPVCLAFL